MRRRKERLKRNIRRTQAEKRYKRIRKTKPEKINIEILKRKKKIHSRLKRNKEIREKKKIKKERKLVLEMILKRSKRNHLIPIIREKRQKRKERKEKRLKKIERSKPIKEIIRESKRIIKIKGKRKTRFREYILNNRKTLERDDTVQVMIERDIKAYVLGNKYYYNEYAELSKTNY